MKKLLLTLIMMSVCIFATAQIKTAKTIYQKLPKEIRDIVPENGSFVPFDAKAEALFVKYSKELEMIAAEVYQMNIDNAKGPYLPNPTPGFAFRKYCAECGYSEPCPLSGECVMLSYGCGLCPDSNCPACGWGTVHDCMFAWCGLYAQ